MPGLAGAGRVWPGVTPATSGGGARQLYGVAAGSGHPAWAVGDRFYRHRAVGVVLRWTGSTWQRIHIPALPGLNGLFSVTAASPRSAWAVGNEHAGAADEGQGVILH